MARYRKIDPRIWNDEKFRRLSDQGKLCFLFLLTHPHMTSLGGMRASLAGLAEEMGWDLKAFRKAFHEGCSEGMIEHDSEACLIAFPNFLKYNRPESPNVLRAWSNSVELLPECELKTRMLQRVRALAKGMSNGFMRAFDECFGEARLHPMPNQEQEQEQEQKQEQDSNSNLKPMDTNSVRSSETSLPTTPPASPSEGGDSEKPHEDSPDSGRRSSHSCSACGRPAELVDERGHCPQCRLAADGSIRSADSSEALGGESLPAEPGRPEGLSSEDAEACAAVAGMEFPTVGAGGSEWLLPAGKAEQWQETYPDMNVPASLKRARQWCRDNPVKRKTAGGMVRFLGGWLSKAQNDGEDRKGESGDDGLAVF